MKFYCKQPIEAEQFDGSQDNTFGYSISHAYITDTAYIFVISDSEDVVEVGDWIVKEADEIKVLTDEAFKKQYAELPAIPKAVADWIKKCKKNSVSIGGAMNVSDLPEKVADYFRKYYTREQWIEIQDTFARAWLDGYQVEADKKPYHSKG